MSSFPVVNLLGYPRDIPHFHMLDLGKKIACLLACFLLLPLSLLLSLIYKYILGFPGGAVVENLPANAGGMGSSPGLGRSHMPRSN